MRNRVCVCHCRSRPCALVSGLADCDSSPHCDAICHPLPHSRAWPGTRGPGRASRLSVSERPAERTATRSRPGPGPQVSPSRLSSATSPCCPRPRLIPTWTHCGVFPALFSTSRSGLPASCTACKGEREKAHRLSARPSSSLPERAHPAEAANTRKAPVRTAVAMGPLDAAWRLSWYSRLILAGFPPAL